MWLGSKALRTGISVMLCMIVSKLLKLKYPFFVALPAVIPISNNLEETIKSGGNRMIGSTIGALVGILLALINPTNILLTGIGSVIIIYTCRFINWEHSASIACLIFISIMVGIKGETVWAYSINRLLDTFIGIAITSTVNSLTFSITAYSSAIKSAKFLYSRILKALEDEVFSNAELKLTQLHKQLNNLEGLLKIYEDQIHFRKFQNLKLEKMQAIYKNLKCASNELDILDSMDKSCSPDAENEKRLNKIFPYTNHREKHILDKVNVVYNYHLEKLLESVNNLQFIIKNDG